MILHKDVSEVVYIFKNEAVTRYCAISVLIVCIFLSLFSYSLSLLILSSYLCGIVVCYLFIKFQNNTALCLQRLIGFYKSYTPSPKKISHSCSVCDGFSCRRHQQNSQGIPWEGLVIDSKLNTALEKFYSKILDEFVLSWYESLSSDKSFYYELQYALKFSTAAIVKKIIETDIPNLISKKLLPCAVKHIDDYMYIEQIAKLKNSRVQDVAIEYLGKRLHGAATCRNNELTYLREVTASLLPFVLPKKYLLCRNSGVLFQEIVAGWVLLPLMDVISDPNLINSLIILGSEYKTRSNKREDFPKKVEFLKNFGNVQNREKSLFYKDLNEIKENTGLLYTFMQFLKSEEQVNLLQFCLDVDEFNNKLMAPDLSKKTLDELYGEAITLHNEYISKDSPNYVKCSEEISTNLKNLLKDGVLSIAKIKVSGPLIQAYKEVFDNLEENWLPLFFQSNEFYSHLCGSKVTSGYTKTSTSRMKRNESPVHIPSTKLSGLGKIRYALKNQTPIEGSLYPPEIQSIESEGEIDVPVCYSLFRDISSWEISISSYVSLNKVIYFHINVKRPSTTNSEIEVQRVVLRKDQDFYTLKAKLVEFHGENVICDSPLPMRKAGSDIGTRMISYERFLKKLLNNSTLRGSDLLYTFLTIEDDFSMYISTCAAPVQDLGNIYQSVTQKLRKEKGQHLDSFMNVFVASTGKDKTGKFMAPEVGDEVDVLNLSQPRVAAPKTYRNYIFNDNFGVAYKTLRKASTVAVNPINFMECLFYVGKNIFNVPNILLRFYVAICSVLSDTVESFWNLFLRKFLRYGLSQQHLEFLATFLYEVIFEDDTESPTKIELENRKMRALKILKELSTKWPYKLLGGNFFRGLERLWEITQHPSYNKQLTYQVLDIVLLELFPNVKHQK